jgi:2-amino-4-hydroxy-6-hydroxymethyldihydropteridine diphosphokinase
VGRAREEATPVILVGLGANLENPLHGPPRETLAAALARLEEAGVAVRARSPWYRSAPVPLSDQPWYVNAVAEVATERSPAELLELLHAVERGLGRVRGMRNAARSADLDLLDYDSLVSEPGTVPALPHPRLHERAFVLLPLRDIAPSWRHPQLGRSVGELIAALPSDQTAERLAPDVRG